MGQSLSTSRVYVKVKVRVESKIRVNVRIKVKFTVWVKVNFTVMLRSTIKTQVGIKLMFKVAYFQVQYYGQG